MNPIYFGSGERRLFGVYTPARGGTATARAIVLCHPFGQEYLRAHRSLRQLAAMLANSGIHVLRFDYHGTGDSAGEMTGASLAGWKKDIETAIEELRDTCGAARVGLLGLRLGATLAAQVVVARPKDVDALVLWDPIVSGRAYLEELRHSADPVRARPAESGGGFEVLGFPLTAAMAGEMAAADLAAAVPGLQAKTLVIASAVLADEARLTAAFAARGTGTGSAALEHIPSAPAWLGDENFRSGAVPVKILQRIVAWLA